MSPDRPRLRASAARLLRFARSHWRMALLQFTLATLGTCLVIVFPCVVQWFLDDLIPSRDLAGIWRVGGLAAGAFFLRELLFCLRTRVSSAFEQRMTTDLRGRLHHKILRLPLGWFDRQSTGDILTRMADDVPATQRVILEGIEQGMTSLLQILICAAVMLSTHLQLALVVMLPVPLIAAGGWLFARWVAPRSREAKEAASRLNSLLHDSVTGIRQIKAYTAEQAKQQGFHQTSEDLRRSQQRLMNAWSIYSPLMGFLGSLGLVLLLSIGAHGVITSKVSTGELFKFIFLLGFFLEPISRLHGVNQTFVNGLASAERVFQLLDQSGEEDLEKGDSLSHAQGEVEFRQVCFSYQDGQPVLRGVSLHALPRQTVAIVGATGSGTLRDNLLLGCANAGDEQLWQALRQASADDFVRDRPDGLDTVVGERGVMLSGGERQRIAMARAFLKNAPMLLLDEATSAVDTKSEAAIQSALEKLRADRTCLVIAHRLSTVVSADVIHVMRQGTIIAHGTHASLLDSCAYYRELTSSSLL
jgi:ABC-type multidrug transport system fused ATPase/permease subunit